MTPPGHRFPFVVRSPAMGAASLAPVMPIQLASTRTLTTAAVLDTGAAVSVMPWSVGLQLGADWNRLATSVQLVGSLAGVPTKVLFVDAIVASFPSVKLAFAWANTDGVPLLLGQVNFFAEFDVCFFRHRGEFEVRPKS